MQTLRRYLPHILTAIVIVALMVGAYVAVAFSASTVPKATWLKNPLSLSFQGSNGTGGTVDSVTCGRAAVGLTLNTHVSKPDLLALNASPSAFSCNSSPSIVSLTATCLVSAAQCRGNYQGIVRIRQPANYRDIPENLQVEIVVT